MEGINILATKMVLDYGVDVMWLLLAGLLIFLFGIFWLYKWDNEFCVLPMILGMLMTVVSFILIFSPIEAHIATIEDDVPYKYIEEHYKIKDKTDNLYTLIPLKEEK